MRHITEEEAARVLEHLKEHGAEDCPVCRARRWNVTGPAVLISCDPSDPVMGPWLETVPMAVIILVCAKCSFVRQFAWVSLLGPLREVREGGAPDGGG